MVRKNKGLLHTALVSGLAMVTAACSSIDSKATQTTDGQGSTNTAKSAQLPMPVATLGSPDSSADLQRPAISAALEQINQLNQKQQYEQSLVLTQQLLKQYPEAPDLALMEGVLFNQLKRTEEAEQVFLRLSEKHPELPEPLNNLAVIYVNRGDLNRAISTLQKAFETHPSYARVQSNLRTLYTTLASQAYNRALNLGSQAPAPVLASLDRIPEQGTASRSIHSEPSLQIARTQPAQIIRASNRTDTASAPVLTAGEKAAVQADIIRAAQQAKTDASSNQTVATAATTEAKATQKAAEAKTPIVIASATQTETAPATTAKKATPAAETPTVAEKPASNDAKPATKPAAEKAKTVVAAVTRPETSKPTAPAKAKPVVDHKALLKAQVMGWAKAWSSKDVSGYLSYYVDNYRPANRLSNKRWKKQRQQRLTKPKFIKVSVSGISIQRKSDTLANVSFTQNYRTNTYRDKVIKTLTFKQQKGEWKISAEVSRKVR